jgi:ABC-type multidrug transport system ATPase subunit
MSPDPGHPHSSKTTRGFYLRWSRLEKTVQIDRNKDAGLMRSSIGDNPKTSAQQQSPKRILDNVSGYAAPGEILAVMGPSGSGKTTLLNCLSGRAKLQSGSIAIAQHVVTNEPALMKRLMAKIAYVQQADIFFGHLTVRDQLTYTALLRWPSSAKTTTTKDEMISEKVHSILQLLRLTKVVDSPIQDLSGGEKKRVNIGTELLTQPPILFLDEPTSGLDSTNAIGLLRLLQRLAQQSHTAIITTIHQPSSSVFFSFDRLMLLSEGKVVYFGTPLESLTYLRNLDLPCPDGYNASDHWMDLLVHDDDDEEQENQNNHDDANKSDTEQQYAWQHSSHKTTSQRRHKLEQAWDKEALAKEMDQYMNPIKDPYPSSTTNNNNGNMINKSSSSHQQQQHAIAPRQFLMGNKYNSSWLRQYLILTHRALRNSRSAIFTPLNLCKSLAIGLVAGVLWFQTEYTEQNINNIRSYYFFTMTFWVFDAMFTSLTAFPAERTVILKERASGSYRLSAYFMAKTTADAPVRLILPFIYMIVSFWMAGISDSVRVFCGTIGCTLLSVLSGEAIGLFVGAAVYDLQKGLTVMTVFTLFLMLLGGFFVENIPVFIAWGKYLSPFKYAFDSSLQLVFDRSMPCDGSGALQELCQNNLNGEVSVDEIRSLMKIQGTVAFNVGMLLILCFVPRYFAYVALRRKKGGERS